MADLVLVRNGQKTDYDLGQTYDVVERVGWRQTPYPQYGVSLAQFGYEGLWKLNGIEEPLSSTIGQQPPVDYYSLPLMEGATAYDAPHVEAA